MITVIRDYEKEAIDNLIKNWCETNFSLDEEHKILLFEKIFLCLKQYGILPKVEEIKLSKN